MINLLEFKEISSHDLSILIQSILLEAGESSDKNKNASKDKKNNDTDCDDNQECDKKPNKSADLDTGSDDGSDHAPGKDRWLLV